MPNQNFKNHSTRWLSRVGQYEIVDELGLGNMATVYRARNVVDGSFVAIKMLSPGGMNSAHAVDQFMREGEALVQLQHPNIVRVRAIGQQKGWSYIVMDYVPGHTLSQEMQTRNFGVHETLEILAPIADALDYLHSKGILHRDVKPGSIRLQAGRIPFLVDFTIAKYADVTLTRECKPMSSVWYLSPEQARGEDATAQSDQYSLAIVAYEMLTGQLPFGEDDLYTIILHQRESQPVIPRQWNESLKTVMRRALDKDPRQRFGSCREFVSSLGAAADVSHPNRPVVSRLHSLIRVNPETGAFELEYASHTGEVSPLLSKASAPTRHFAGFPVPSDKPDLRPALQTIAKTSFRAVSSMLSWIGRGMVSVHSLFPAKRSWPTRRFYNPSRSVGEALSKDINRFTNLTLRSEVFKRISSEAAR